MAEYTITTVHDVGRLGDDLRPVNKKIVTYKVGIHGPFTIEVESVGDWDLKVTELIQADVMRLRRLGLIP